MLAITGQRIKNRIRIDKVLISKSKHDVKPRLMVLHHAYFLCVERHLFRENVRVKLKNKLRGMTRE